MSTIAMQTSTKRLRFIALISHILLIVWMIIWYFGIGSSAEYSTLFVFLLYILPLLLPLPGLIKAKPYTHAWCSFILLLYFLHAITVLYAEPSQVVYAAIELTLACIAFVGCSLFARIRGQELGTGLKKLSQVMAEEKSFFEGNSDEKKP